MVARTSAGLVRYRERFGILDAAKSVLAALGVPPPPPPAHGPPCSSPRRPRGGLWLRFPRQFRQQGGRGGRMWPTPRAWRLGESGFGEGSGSQNADEKKKHALPRKSGAVMDFAPPRITLNYVNGAIMPETLAGH